jgi:thioredoxin 1
VLDRRKSLRVAASVGFMSILALVCFASLSWSADPAPPVPEVPAKGMVTMVDIGAKKCIPCKMMAPIMEELEKEYKGKAAIIFIDVWVDPPQSKRFGIRSIPTQIFYDRDGKEVKRHEGFMDKKAIVAELEKLGVK